MAGETNLDKLLDELNPLMNEGEYVFYSFQDEEHMDQYSPVVTVKEKEGVTAIIKREMADRHKITYESTYTWITLQVHSSLDAVGLTAAFSHALAAEGISCNMVSGYYHDHIFIKVEDADEALRVLRQLSSKK